MLDDREVLLGWFEKYLSLWVMLSRATGFHLGKLLQGIGLLIQSLQVGEVSILMGICPFLLMYRAMASIEFEEIVKAAKSPKPVILTFIGNWVVAPALMSLLGCLFYPVRSAERYLKSQGVGK